MHDEQESTQRGTYQITVRGHLDQKWVAWFDGFTIIPQADNTTKLTGKVEDQAALHGLLAKIRDLGLSLISIIQLENGMDES
ncbi:hypothetical protein AMJ86_07225 [bacterium SM23_57]|jgi:hypothetical protein|nr:MAG: hypothetical protein AMJ86_07225 [bacterium SM23_57]